MNKPDLAIQIFDQNYNCSQAVLSVYAEELGLDLAQALKIATGFGAGIARSGQVCGAVSGACMAIGLKHGMGSAGEIDQKAKTYQLVQEFNRLFTQQHGSISCPDLLGMNIGTAAGYQAALDKGLFKSVCPILVHDAVIILGDIL